MKDLTVRPILHVRIEKLSLMETRIVLSWSDQTEFRERYCNSFHNAMAHVTVELSRRLAPQCIIDVVEQMELEV